MPLPVVPRKPRRGTSAVLAAAMTALGDVIEGKPPANTQIEMQDESDQPTDEPVALDLDPLEPDRSLAVLRPWLLDDEDDQKDGQADDQEKDDG